jgi:DNA polymerase III delta prime subunit
VNRRPTRFEIALRKKEALHEAEKSGVLADGMEVRLQLIEKMHAGEMTLEQVQQELKRIKRNAKKNGLMTRSQVWRES